MSNNENKDLNYNIEFQEVSRDFRTEIPNIVMELFQQKKISSYALILYLNLRRTAGEHGKSWKGTRLLAKECGCSLGQISNSKKELSQDFELLDGMSLIKIIPANKQKETADTILITDIWRPNYKYFKKLVTCSHTESPVFTYGITRVHVQNQKKEPYKKEPYKNLPPLSSKKIDEPKEIQKEEEDFSFLSIYLLSPKQLSQLKEFPAERVKESMELAWKDRKIKSKVGWVLNRLRNPEDFSENPEQTLSKNQLLALQHNEFLKDYILPTEYQSNIQRIKEEKYLYLYLNNGKWSSTSCKDNMDQHDLKKDFNDSERIAKIIKRKKYE